eukprot:TRINITY_DN10143_c0_g1_i6.p1 TRINITY_DN10143_c0_g1~~TRINITY_DN10143_c0_g1_i6.p1  ORF type:complete len:121 (+),score=16.52 TRINITY_DN10143_c0_g1_i6:887-1249(+)
MKDLLWTGSHLYSVLYVRSRELIYDPTADEESMATMSCSVRNVFERRKASMSCEHVLVQVVVDTLGRIQHTSAPSVSIPWTTSHNTGTLSTKQAAAMATKAVRRGKQLQKLVDTALASTA